jgi:hypothetical protein
MQISKIGQMDLVVMYSSAEEVHINNVNLTLVRKEKATYFVRWECRVMQGSAADAVGLLAWMIRLFLDSCTWRTVNKKLVEGERQLWGGKESQEQMWVGKALCKHRQPQATDGHGAECRGIQRLFTRQHSQMMREALKLPSSPHPSMTEYGDEE